MEENNVKIFLEKLNEDESFAKKVYTSQSKEDVQSLAKKVGIEINLDELDEVKGILKKIEEIMKNKELIKNEEISDKELENATGGMKIRLNYINRSNNANNSNIVIFQKPTNPDWDMGTIAWKVIKNCGQSDNHPFEYDFNFQFSSTDSYGNYSTRINW